MTQLCRISVCYFHHIVCIKLQYNKYKNYSLHNMLRFSYLKGVNGSVIDPNISYAYM